MGNPVPRSLVIRWPPARDPHWLGVQTAPAGVEQGMLRLRCTWCIMSLVVVLSCVHQAVSGVGVVTTV